MGKRTGKKVNSVNSAFRRLISKLSGNGRVLLLAAIAVCLIILLIVSLALRFGHTETPVLVERAVTAMLSVIEGSENVWLMI